MRKDAGQSLDAVSSRILAAADLSNATLSDLDGDFTVHTSVHDREADGCQLHPGKRLVLLTVDNEFSDFFENWLLHAEKIIDPNKHKVVVVPEDEGVVSTLKRLQTTPERFEIMEDIGAQSDLFQVGDVSNTTPWGTKGFSHLVNSRPRRLLHILEKGCPVLYVDTDTVWLKDPFKDVDAAGLHDIYLTDDHGNPNAFQTHNCKNGDIWNFCTCFMYVRPTEQAKQLMQSWILRAQEKMKHDQYTLNQPEFNEVLCNSNSSYTMLPREKYPSGEVFNLRGVELRGENAPVVVHANYRVGHDAKRGFMVSHGMWDLEKAAQVRK